MSYTLPHYHARALLPYLFLHQSSGEQNNPAKIDGHSRVALWLSPDPSQVSHAGSDTHVIGTIDGIDTARTVRRQDPATRNDGYLRKTSVEWHVTQSQNETTSDANDTSAHSGT